MVVDSANPIKEGAMGMIAFSKIALSTTGDTIFKEIAFSVVDTVNAVPGVCAPQVGMSAGHRGWRPAVVAVGFKHSAGFGFCYLKV